MYEEKSVRFLLSLPNHLKNIVVDTPFKKLWFIGEYFDTIVVKLVLPAPEGEMVKRRRRRKEMISLFYLRQKPDDGPYSLES